MKKFFVLCFALLFATTWNTVYAQDDEDDSSEEATALENLESLLDSIAELDLSFTTSDEPGYYIEDSVAIYEAALDAAYTAYSEDLSDEEYNAAADELRAALEMVLEAVNPLPSGYYYIISTAYFYEVGTGEDDYGEYISVTKAMYDTGAGGLRWKTFDEGSLYQMWIVEELEDGNYSVQNVGTEDYVMGSTETNTEMPTSDSLEVEQRIIGLGDGTFAFCSTLTDWSYHTGNHDEGEGETGVIMIWLDEYNSDNRNTWIFQSIDEEYVDSVKEASETPYALLEVLIDSIDGLSLDFETGDEPGQYDETTINAYNDAYEAAVAGLGEYLSDDEYTALADALREALQAAIDSEIKLDGYYYIVSAAEFYDDDDLEVTKAMFEGDLGGAEYDGDYGEGGLWWGTWDEESAYQIWKISPLDDGGYSVQNVATGNYIYGQESTNNQVPTSEEQEVAQNIVRQSGGYYAFYSDINYYSDGYYSYHTGWHDSGYGTYGVIQVWSTSYADYARNIWYFYEVDDEDLLNEIMLTELDNTFFELLDEAYDYSGIEISDNGTPGYPSEDDQIAIYTAWENAATAYEEIEGDITYDELKVIVDTLQAAIDDFITAISPKTDTWYYIVSAAEEDEYAGHYLYASIGEVDGESLPMGYLKHGGTDDDGNVLDETLTDLRYMWRIVEVDGEYGLQNRATGTGLTAWNQATYTYLTDVEDGTFNITYVGDALFTLWYLRAYTYYLAPYEENYAGSYYSETSSEIDQAYISWQFLPVEIEASEENYVTLPVMNNSISIQCRPFEIGTWGEGDEATTVKSLNADMGVEVSTYTVKSCLYDEESGATTVELTLQDEFEAGEPFVIVVGDYEAYEGYLTTDTFSLMLPVPTEFTDEPGEVDGMVGNFISQYFPEEGLGYIDFDSDSLYFLVTEDDETYQNYNSGYFKATADEGEGEADLTLYFDGAEITKVISAAQVTEGEDEPVNVYDLNGRLLKSNVAASDATSGLQKGVYIVGGKKVIVK